MVAGIAGSRPGLARAPRNAWYVVAFSDEVTAKPLARRILGDRTVLFRTSDGKPVMLTDRCAHRAMALSEGKVVGDRIQCPYHGMEYGASGACELVPSQPVIPETMKVRSYPLVETWRWIWGWMGDPALADPALIPDHSEFGLDGDPAMATVARFMMPIGGSYQLLHENLMDVSHISFLHEGSFDSGKIAHTPAKTTVDGDRIRISRHVTETATGLYSQVFALGEGVTVERELRSETWVPNLNVITNVFRFPDDPARPTMVRYSPFAITPETETSCHYFVAAAANGGLATEGEALERANAVSWDIFLTDKVAIESIQEAYLELGEDTPDASVRADVAAMRFREVLERQLLAEAAASKGVQAAE